MLAGGVLVPVPGQPAGNRRRGFDHAHEIARELGRLAGLEVAGALRRAPVRAQVGLGRAERGANARASVSVQRTEVPRGGRAILVDDVYTTGATLDACALALLGAGEVVASASPGPCAGVQEVDSKFPHLRMTLRTFADLRPRVRPCNQHGLHPASLPSSVLAPRRHADSESTIMAHDPAAT